MKYSLVVIFLLAFGLAACGKTMPVPTSDPQTGQIIHFIKKISENKGSYSLDATSSVMLTGEAAITRALKETSCSRQDIIENNCLQMPSPDFYITKPGPSQTLTLNQNAKVEIVQTPESGAQLVAITLAQFVNRYNQSGVFSSETPFIFEIKNGVVEKITEQYTP